MVEKWEQSSCEEASKLQKKVVDMKISGRMDFGSSMAGPIPWAT